MNGIKGALKEQAWDSHLGKHERDRARTPLDANADLDVLGLQARKGPCRNLVGQVGSLQEHPERA